MVFAFAKVATYYPPTIGWQAPCDAPVNTTIQVTWQGRLNNARDRSKQDHRPQEHTEEWEDSERIAAQPQQPKSHVAVDEFASSAADDSYVEWRRSLPTDEMTGLPSDNSTFLRLCTKLGLHTHPKDAVSEPGKCELNLWRTKYGGCLTFYENKKGQISIGQTNKTKKEALWWLLEPHTCQCQARPSKRKRSITKTKVAKKLAAAR